MYVIQPQWANLGLYKAIVIGFGKTVEISTAHVSPKNIAVYTECTGPVGISQIISN